jgi:hypothetical protein
MFNLFDRGKTTESKLIAAKIHYDQRRADLGFVYSVETDDTGPVFGELELDLAQAVFAADPNVGALEIVPGDVIKKKKCRGRIITQDFLNDLQNLQDLSRSAYQVIARAELSVRH